MKTIKSIIVILGLVCFSTVTYAMDEMNPNFNVEQVGNEKIKLTFDNSQSAAYLKIENLDGEVVYFETIQKADNYVRVFDLNALSNGVYAIKVEFEDRIISQTASINNNVLTLGYTEVFAKPIFNISGNTISVRIPGIQETEVEVEITDVAGFEIYKKTESVEKNFGKLYVLNKLDREDYYVTVSFDGRSYNKFISVK